MDHLPLIDLRAPPDHVAQRIGEACRAHGFFYIVGHGIAASLGLPADDFAHRYTADPLVLFRIFDYPSRPIPHGLDVRDGVGEHTDYGLLTLLRQDAVGGLEVRTTEGWIDAPPVPESFV